MVVRFKTDDVTVHLAAAGAGKAGWVNALIPTPDGYKRFGTIKVGDKVFSAEGKPVTVTGVYPRGFMDAYKVTLSDGRSSICAADHLWGVYDQGHREWVYKVMSLEEMLSKGIRRVDPRPGRTFGQPKFYIPASPVCEYGDKELPVDSYALGSLIGNGCLTEKYLTISSNDEWQVAKVADRLGFTYHKRSDFNYSWDFYKDGKRVRTDSVIDFETLRCGAGAKFIPYDYLTSGLKSRIELLQGLFDTDGCVSTVSGRLHVTYSTTSYALVTSLRQLLLSLGIVSTIREDKREGKNICYELKVNCDTKLKELLFSLPRKAEKVKNFKRQVKHHYDRVAIRSVEKLEHKLEMQCIMVDDPAHLYLCEDYIVTHNTTAAMQEIVKALATYRPDEIAFVTYTKKGVENGIERALAVNKDLTPDDLMHFKTLHALCFREAHLARKNIITAADIAAFNQAMGFKLSLSDAFGYATEDDRLLQRYDAMRSGSKRGVFVDGNYDHAQYERLINAYVAFKEGHDLVDFYDCLLRYMENGEPLQGVKIAFIDECFAPDTKVRMGDGTVREIKDIKVGDFVMGVQGPVEVTSVHSGFDVMFDVISGKNKRMYTCNSQHLIQQRHANDDGYRWSHCEDIKRRAFVECTWFEGKDFIKPKIDPYFFGLWLGNGLSRDAAVICNENDTETISWLKAYGESLGDKVTLRHRTGIYQVEYSLPHKVPGQSCAVRKQLESYGFMCPKAKTNPLRDYADKRIPSELLQATRDIRYRLLAGIIDSDGMYVACGSSSAHKYRIEMARKPLMEDIYELLCGLGLNPTWYVTHHTTNGVCREYYRVDFFGNSNIKCLLPRKQYVRAYDESRISCHISQRGIGQYIGITVDSDNHLFLLANGCVVHNCQDLTPLQWQVCMKAFENAEKVICLGDDFQSLYTYNGAAPELLIEMAAHYKLVKHETSYRLPRKVYEFARGITSVIQEKVDKDYKPATDKEGFVKNVTDRNVLARIIRDDLKHNGHKGGRWYLLFRTNCFIADMAKVLEQFMVPYNTNKGFCIPSRDLARIERYYNYRKEGYGTPEARQKFMEEYKIEDINDSFIHSELIPGIERYYYQDLVDTWGLKALREMSQMTEPFLLLSTVHKVKGGEADFTAMFMDCTRLVSENMTLNVDEELRVLYVGCTRCREGLYIVPAQGRYSMSRLVDIIKEVNDV